jgi:hypothetical protein
MDLTINIFAVKLDFFYNSLLNIFGEFKKELFSMFGKIVADHLRRTFFLTSFPDTLPVNLSESESAFY